MIVIPETAGIAVAVVLLLITVGVGALVVTLLRQRAPAPATPDGGTGAPTRPGLIARAKLVLSLKQWPTKYAVAASLICGAVTVLNQTTFALPSIWQTSLTWALGLFAFLGIGPILGPKFKAALHLPPKVATGISIALMAAMIITQQNASMPYRAIIIGVIQVAGGLGFAPAYVPTVAI